MKLKFVRLKQKSYEILIQAEIKKKHFFLIWIKYFCFFIISKILAIMKFFTVSVYTTKILKNLFL